MDELVSQFVAVTGAKPETAAFFLESAGGAAGDLQAAVDQYYTSGGNVPADGGGDAGAGGNAGPSQAAAPAAVAAAAPAAAAAPKPAARKNRGAAGNVRSLADISGDDEESDDDGHNDYYVGGEKRCGAHDPRGVVIREVSCVITVCLIVLSACSKRLSPLRCWRTVLTASVRVARSSPPPHPHPHTAR